jgi:hypothetical protein
MKSLRTMDRMAGRLLAVPAIAVLAGWTLNGPAQAQNASQPAPSVTIGLHVDVGNWVTGQRLKALTGGLFPDSSGLAEARARAAVILGKQVRLQAYTLAYSDAFIFLAVVAAVILVLIALMKPMKIYFDAPPAEPST